MRRTSPECHAWLHERLPTVEAKTLSEVTFATLGEILGVGTYDDLVERAGHWRDAQSDGAGVLSVPPEIRDALATAADLDASAERWAETARDARASDSQLWYWWSL